MGGIVSHDRSPPAADERFELHREIDHPSPFRAVVMPEPHIHVEWDDETDLSHPRIQTDTALGRNDLRIRSTQEVRAPDPRAKLGFHLLEDILVRKPFVEEGHDELPDAVGHPALHRVTR